MTRALLEEKLENYWDNESNKFVNYWFAQDTQIELMALLEEIENIEILSFRYFFEMAFSAIIITKTGGVSLALDLAHTRPHKAKYIITQNGTCISNNDFSDSILKKNKILTKTLRSPIDEFGKRVKQNIKSIIENKPFQIRSLAICANAQNLPLKNESVDLIITSPPYASNAIDYMRAHKFSLVWLGHRIKDLSTKRKEYIGGETFNNTHLIKLPDETAMVVKSLSSFDKKKGIVLHRYYSEMTLVLEEMYRTLKPGKVAIVVVGNSILRGKDTKIPECLADIGRAIGFEIPAIGIRNLDRNRRMLPAGAECNLSSQIQQRMHKEYVIGFFKPEQ